MDRVVKRSKFGPLDSQLPVQVPNGGFRIKREHLYPNMILRSTSFLLGIGLELKDAFSWRTPYFGTWIWSKLCVHAHVRAHTHTTPSLAISRVPPLLWFYLHYGDNITEEDSSRFIVRIIQPRDELYQRSEKRNIWKHWIWGEGKLQESSSWPETVLGFYKELWKIWV